MASRDPGGKKKKAPRISSPQEDPRSQAVVIPGDSLYHPVTMEDIRARNARVLTPEERRQDDLERYIAKYGDPVSSGGIRFIAC